MLDERKTEIQPSTRLAWTPDPDHTVWGAISRAVRTPFRSDQDIRFKVATTSSGSILLNDVGNPDFKSEELLAYELGCRAVLHPKLSADFATFYNDYDHLRTFQTVSSGVISPDNKMTGQTYGAEVTANWQAMEKWRIQANYSFLKILLHQEESGNSGTAEAAERENPQHQLVLRSLMDLPFHLELDSSLFYVQRLSGLRVPSHMVADIRLGWRPTKQWEISVVAQNLLDNHHPEFIPANPFFSITEVESSVYAKATYQW